MAEPLPQPPFHLVSGLPNCRDLGFYPLALTRDKVIRPGLVFRSSEPSQITPDGVAQLQSLGIRHVYDLRSQQEIDRALRLGKPGRVTEWDGAERVFTPVFLDQDYSPEAIAERFGNYCSDGPDGFVLAYKAILHAGASEHHPSSPFRKILAHLASDSPAPILIHCTAGKDRTGVICAVILSLCGVADEVVADEYALTTRGLQHRTGEFTKSLLNHPAILGNRTAVERMIGSRKEAMLATLGMIRTEFGSVEGFVVNECGLSAESVHRIKQNLIVDKSSVSQSLDLEKVFQSE